MQGGFDCAPQERLLRRHLGVEHQLALDGNSGRVALSLEWDFYGGYKGTLPADFVVDLGVLYYYYPGS